MGIIHLGGRPDDMAITDSYSTLMDLLLVQDQAVRAHGKYRIFNARTSH